MLAVVLSAVAIALGTRRYTQRHLDGYAVMRCLGAAQSQLFALFAWEILVLALAASVAGCALGLVVQTPVAWVLAPPIPGTLPPPGAATAPCRRSGGSAGPAASPGVTALRTCCGARAPTPCRSRRSRWG